MKNSLILRKLGKHLSEIRKRKGISQENLALESGISRSNIYSIEAGKSNPKFITLLKISKTLKTPIHELMNVK